MRQEERPQTPQRVLVTGASGFIGANLVRALLRQGHETHAVVRSPASAWRLQDLEGLSLHRADLREASALREVVGAVAPHTVFHAAAHGTMPNQKERHEALSSNLLGTANLLDALEDVPYTRLVNLGSSSEYGHVEGPMREGEALHPRTAYGVGKAAATLLCQAEALRGRPACTVRVFSAYGPWEDPSRIASSVALACLEGKPPRVGTGTPPRDFIHVDDVVELLLLAASHPGAVGAILHAGTGRVQRVRDMVEAVLRASGTGLKAEYGTALARADEPTCWVASIEQTTALTGWRPRVSLDEGARRLLEWLKERGPAPLTQRGAA